jgi:hypothetical protein
VQVSSDKQYSTNLVTGWDRRSCNRYRYWRRKVKKKRHKTAEWQRLAGLQIKTCINGGMEAKVAEKSIADHETFVTLIRTAQEDAAIGSRLRAILGQPPFHRRSLLHTLVAELQMQSAPADFVRAVAFLLEDDVARKARDLLNASGPTDS